MSRKIYYKFCPAKWALDNIINNRIKLSRISELNDPHEMYGYYEEDREKRRLIRIKFRRIDREFGIISLSSNWKSPLLWAHYASNHSGIALGYEFDETKNNNIDYIRFKEDSPIKGSRDISDSDFIDNYILKKSIIWSYEDEVRIVKKLTECHRDGGKYYYCLNEDTQLKEIILGIRFNYRKEDPNTIERVRHILEQGGVSLKTARASFRRFEMTEQKAKKLQKSLGGS